MEVFFTYNVANLFYFSAEKKVNQIIEGFLSHLARGTPRCQAPVRLRARRAVPSKVVQIETVVTFSKSVILTHISVQSLFLRF